jgi:hypothetical protein
VRPKKPTRLIGTLALAAKLNVHPMTIPRLRKKKKGFPQPTLLFGKNQWDEDVIDAYIAAEMAQQQVTNEKTRHDTE